MPSNGFRFCIPNIPSLAGRSASEQMTRLSLPYMVALTKGLQNALRIYPELASAVNAHEGKILLEAVREAHGL